MQSEQVSGEEPKGSNEGRMGRFKPKDANDGAPSQGRDLFILLENPSKGNNLGPILRCAAAFGVRQIVAVGYDKCSTEGSHGAAKHVEIVAFPTIDQAVSYLRNECRCSLLFGLLGGAPDDNQARRFIVKENVESGTVQAAPLHEQSGDTNFRHSMRVQQVQPFSHGNCCLVISKSWRGLPVPLAACCDSFVHVPHTEVRSDGNGFPRAALLDTQSCLSIVLHYFTALADHGESTFQGHKFEVIGQQQRLISLEAQRDSKAAARLEAKRIAAQEAEDALEDGIMGAVFGGETGDDY